MNEWQVCVLMRETGRWKIHTMRCGVFVGGVVCGEVVACVWWACGVFVWCVCACLYGVCVPVCACMHVWCT